MNKNLLGLALLSAVSLSQAVAAQEYDDRWYVTGTAGVYVTDDDRQTTNAGLLGLGFGKRINPNVSIELSIDRTNPIAEFDLLNGNTDWTLTSAFITGRYYFVKEGRTWQPFVGGGLGLIRHEDELNGYFEQSGSRDGSDYGVQLVAGFETARMKRVDVRIEAGARYDSDSFNYYRGGQETFSAVPQYEGGPFLDYFAAATLLVKLGDLPAPVVAAPPAAPTCDTLDGDNDGVNDCNDKCPGSEAGQTIGADGCPVKLTIDLKGVNFDFDKDTLRPDAVVILDEAVAVLQKYPQLKVEVAGHTDLCGKDGYNQDLSQRRSQTVFSYLTDHGVDAARLSGPSGYGESRPLEATEQSSPACKSETNRRTELNVQN